ncbi:MULTISPECIES: SPOR domain-containing protein [Corallincola]|uniref:SPOR domain-containing protein n=1 Tax=Corallincola TaxID=1775176 RepID=UPI001314CA2E|nr:MULTISPECIES: SPOR domain-containing protein [Corallincola]
MANQLTNRLVGTVALLAVGIIVLPDLLDGEKQRHSDEFAVIPLKPEVDLAIHQDDLAAAEGLVEQEDTAAALLAENQPPVVDIDGDNVVVSEPDIDAATPAPVVVKPVKSAPKLEGFKDNAWAIQLGGFKNAKNVNGLINKLEKGGYTVYTRPKTPKDGMITRVYIGPSLDKQALESKLESLKKLTGLTGQLTAYNPLEQ